MSELRTRTVYDNLVKMVAYRGAALSGEPLTHDQLDQKLNHTEYATITATRGDADPRGAATLIINLIAPGSKYSTKSPDFAKLVKTLPKQGAVNAVYITSNAVTSHIRKYVAQSNHENPRVYLEIYDYSKFQIEAPRHVSVPKHRIMSAVEAEELMNWYYLSKEQFPHILEGEDTQAIWIGARAGMLVEIIRRSESAGEFITYRVCVAPPQN